MRARGTASRPSVWLVGAVLLGYLGFLLRRRLGAVGGSFGIHGTQGSRELKW